MPENNTANTVPRQTYETERIPRPALMAPPPATSIHWTEREPNRSLGASRLRASFVPAQPSEGGSPLRPPIVAAFALVLLPLACIAQATPGGPKPPRSWVDKDTGHRVWRLSDEPNSGAFYFNINGYTPDNKQMIYSAPDGIHVLDLATRATKLLVANPKQPDGTAASGRDPGVVHILVAGHKTNSVFYTTTDANHVITIYKADTNTGAVRKFTDVPHQPSPSGWSVVTVNADETLIAGTYVEGDDTGRQYGSNLPAQPAGAAPGAAGNPDNRVGSAAQGPHYQPPHH